MMPKMQELMQDQASQRLLDHQPRLQQQWILFQDMKELEQEGVTFPHHTLGTCQFKCQLPSLLKHPGKFLPSVKVLLRKPSLSMLPVSVAIALNLLKRWCLPIYRLTIPLGTDSRRLLNPDQQTGIVSLTMVADAYCGVAPKPWDIPVTTPALFKDNTKALKVPFTSSVKGCHTCLGLGLTACRHCVSSGWIQCSGCQGSGTRFSSDRCITCSGRGRVRCSYCSGRGSHQCKTCSGKGKLLCFIKLTVKWKNNVKEYAVDTRSGFPMDQIFSVSGEKVFSDTHPLVSPIRGFPADKINEASENSVREHFAQFSSSCRIMQQRQTIELVPITRVHYIWKENANFFFVYGNEHKVYTDDYPATCCCTLL
ncbi:protein SSUH2 homolog isoform X2 [Lepisosteus oculatus]|uniref:protein SSUH2 homolog isoform X2 n=1 Tax=Lepisosteus oculatus TaxID=7918 RepID=UPI00372206D3